MNEPSLPNTDLLKSHKINYIGKIILLGFLLSVAFHLIKSLLYGFQYPNNTFLFVPRYRFSDFFILYKTCKGLNPYVLGRALADTSNYYPFANILAFFFTLLPQFISFILFSLTFILSFLYVNISNLTTSHKFGSAVNIFIFTFLTYPFLFCVDRANNENIIFIFLYFFIHFYNRKKFIVSVIFLSLAIAMKAFPAVFLIFFLSEKKYKETIITMGLVILLTVSSLIFHQGSFSSNLNFVLSGFNFSKISYLCNSNNIVQRGVSLFTLAKIYFIQTSQIASVDMVKFLGMYIKAVFSMFILLSGYALFIEKEPWKKVMILVASALLFPHASADFKLIYIFIPMFMFINTDKKSRFDLFYIIMFGLLLIPKDYYIFPKIISDSRYSDISIAVILNILMLILMVIMIVIDGFINRPAEQKAGKTGKEMSDKGG